MYQKLGRFWADDRGSVLVTEWVFLTTILVIALLPGIHAVRQRVNLPLAPNAHVLRSEINCWSGGPILTFPAQADGPGE
jgi:hypothetical protein